MLKTAVPLEEPSVNINVVAVMREGLVILEKPQGYVVKIDKLIRG